MLKLNKNTIKWLKFILCLSIIFLGLGYCFRLLGKNFSVSQLQNINFNWWWLSISVVFAVLHFCCLSISWHVLTKIFDCSLPLKLSLPIWSVTYIGRYIPGKVPYLMGRIMAYQSHGANLGSITFVAILDNLFHIYIGTFVAFLTLIFLPSLSALCKLCLFVAVVIQSIIILNPHVCKFVLVKIAKIKSLNLDTSNHNITFLKLLKVFFIYLSAYLPLAIGLFVLVRSFAFIPFNYIGYLIGSLAFGIIFGIVAIIAPSGLGVREGAFAWLLKYFVTPELAAVISLLARIWMSISELIYLLIMVIWFLISHQSLSIFKKN